MDLITLTPFPALINSLAFGEDCEIDWYTWGWKGRIEIIYDVVVVVVVEK